MVITGNSTREGGSFTSLKPGASCLCSNEWITLQGRGTKVGTGQDGRDGPSIVSAKGGSSALVSLAQTSISPCHWATTTSAKNGSTCCHTLAFALLGFAAVWFCRHCVALLQCRLSTYPARPSGSYLSMSRLQFLTQVSELRCHFSRTA